MAEEAGKPFHFEGGIPVFEARLDTVERKAREAETRDEEYKNRQVSINFRMMVFTGLLVLTSLVTSGIGIWQATIANTSAQVAKKNIDLQIKIAEGSQSAWLMPSQQELNRNFLSFGVQNMGSINAENVAVTVEMKLIMLSDSQTLWTESFTFDTVKYLAPKQNTNGQRERIVSKYTRQNFELITKEKETLILNWTATYDNGFKRNVQQSGCAQYLALFKAPEVRAMPQWVSCEGSPQLLRQLQPPSKQWSLQ
jgi:hypothetical protein